jgi:hypothetical protein
MIAFTNITIPNAENQRKVADHSSISHQSGADARPKTIVD